MIGAIKSLFTPPRPVEFTAPMEIDRPTYAVGDVHGRFDLLAPLIRAIAEDAEKLSARPRLVFMGDYVDRGEQSRQVLDYVFELAGPDAARTDGDVVMLRGNHEEMLLEFLEEPERGGARWLRNGGLQTLLSYGVGGVSAGSADPAALQRAAEELRAAMGPLPARLESLPIRAQFGNVHFAHAGADPALPLDQQSERALVWGTQAMLREPRRDGMWVLHGHYVVDEADALRGRIAVDTGAYFSGRLTAARLMDGAIDFIEVGD